MWTIFKVFMELVTISLLFFFGWETREILAPQSGIESAAAALEGEVLTTGSFALTLSFTAC